MIIEMNEPKDCPFVAVDDCGAGCNLDIDIHCWTPTWSDFPKDCPLLKEKNILVKFIPIKKTLTDSVKLSLKDLPEQPFSKGDIY